MDSSPFVESPLKRRPNGNSERDSGIVTAGSENVDALKTTINALQYQLKDMRTSLELSKVDAESRINTLQNDLTQQQQRNDTLSSDNIFLYNQQNELQTKLTHLNENFAAERTNYLDEIKNLKSQLFTLKESFDYSQSTTKYKITQFEQDSKNSQLEITRLNAANQQLKIELDAQSSKIKDSKAIIMEKDSQIEKLNNQLLAIPSKQEIDSVDSIKKELTEQITYIKDLESKNLCQAEKIKQFQLRQDKIEVLKEEKAVLQKKASKIDQLNDIISDLNFELLNLKQERTRWKVYLDDPDDFQIEQFVKNFKKVNDDNLLLQNNFNKLENDLKCSKQSFNELSIKYETLKLDHEKLLYGYDNVQKINFEIEEQKKLLVEESNFLRDQLKNLDQELSLNEDDKNRYIKNLEGLVDEYKAKIDQFGKERSDNPKKRSRSESDFDEDSTRAIQNKVLRLEEENLKLNNELVRITNENSVLLKKIDSIEDIKSKKFRILELRNNPFRNEQIVKKKMLETLQQENNELLKKTKFCEQVPKSVYDRSQQENHLFMNKISDLEKRIKRLREIFSAKSLEFIDAAYSLLGFKLVFLPSNKIKLISKFVSNPANCIIIDASKQTLKTIKANENEDFDFFKISNSLIDFWIKDKNEIPCFLAALTLELFEKSAS